MAHIRGGCLCGAVRYESSAEPEFVGVCHCRNCQKNSGSAFTLDIGMPEGSVSFRGDSLVNYEDRNTTSSKPLYRSFCSRCGSPISGWSESFPGLVFLKAGTLDDPSWIKPNAHIWCASKQPWVTIDKDVAQFPGNPP